uniref:Uncharacterized protein n=1 Tax=Tanacetum cinerariifolium TaxID=118510 RepID=A0A6L2MXD7_TANCI|nr:hypothetical protein [Tanacetum cinerariifolium]
MSKKRITEVPQLSETTHDIADEHVTTTSNDLLRGEDKMKLTKLMELYTQLQSRIFALETTKANQALEIGSLKKKVKKLEKKASKKTHKLKIFYKIGSSTRVESSKDASLGDQEDASKQERMIKDLDADEGVPLEVSTADPVPIAGEVVTTAGVEVSTTAITSQIYMDEITSAKALIDIKSSKPKAEGIVIQEPTKGSEKAQKDSFKRAGDNLEQEDAKRQRIEKENDSTELKRCMEIMPEYDDDVTIEATPLSSKFPTIVDYKIYKDGRKTFSNSSEQMNMVYYLLVEKMYLFKRNILHQMWNYVRLQLDYEVEMAYDLIRLIMR